MTKMQSVDDAAKGDKVFVRDISPMWDSKSQEMYDHCFEYVFEVIRNNPKTLGCQYINGPYRGSGFNWVKGGDLRNNKKEYFIIDNDSEITERNFRLQ